MNVALTGALFGVYASAEAQAKGYRLGILEFGSATQPSGEMGAFVDQLARFGIVEGKNLMVDRRFAGSDRNRLDSLAAELVALKPDVLFTAGGTRGALAAKKATTTIPIVFDASNDPVAARLVESLARPGGNLTGNINFGKTLDFKRLQILGEVVGDRPKIGVVDAPVPAELQGQYLSNLSAAVGRSTRLHLLEVDGAASISAAFERMASERFDAVAISHSPITAANRQLIAALAEKHRFPAIADGRSYAEAGLLLAYTTNFEELYRRAGEYVYRILKGAAPGDLPVEHASKFEFVVNLRTARSLGIRVPRSVLARADHLID